METPSQQRLVIPNTDALEYSVVVPNILPRTPYYVRVGAMNEMGLGLYRVTPTPVAALVIAEKPINVVLMLINSTHDALQNSVEVSRAALSTSVFVQFETVEIDWNWVRHYKVEFSRSGTFNSSHHPVKSLLVLSDLVR